MILGRFAENKEECKKCGHRWITHNEKQSGVNLASLMVGMTAEHSYDRAILVSQDSNFARAVKYIIPYRMNKMGPVRIMKAPQISSNPSS